MPHTTGKGQYPCAEYAWEVDRTWSPITSMTVSREMSGIGYLYCQFLARIPDRSKSTYFAPGYVRKMLRIVAHVQCKNDQFGSELCPGWYNDINMLPFLTPFLTYSGPVPVNLIPGRNMHRICKEKATHSGHFPGRSHRRDRRPCLIHFPRIFRAGILTFARRV